MSEQIEPAKARILETSRHPDDETAVIFKVDAKTKWADVQATIGFLRPNIAHRNVTYMRILDNLLQSGRLNHKEYAATHPNIPLAGQTGMKHQISFGPEPTLENVTTLFETAFGPALAEEKMIELLSACTDYGFLVGASITVEQENEILLATPDQVSSELTQMTEDFYRESSD